MPVIAHIMLALVYVTASTIGAAALIRYLAFDPVMAGVLGAVTALALIQIHMALTRAAGGGQVADQLFEMKGELRRITARVVQAEARAEELKASFETEVTARRETIVNEMRGLEDMIAKLGRNFKSRLQIVRAQAIDTTLDGGGALDAVKDALRENRVDLHLQPIVNLPQRRVCFYEGFTRLRRPDGKLIMPGEFLAAAERANLLGVIDNMLLFRCVQIVRRLSERDRRVGVFCNVSMASLEDEQFFPVLPRVHAGEPRSRRFDDLRTRPA